MNDERRNGSVDSKPPRISWLAILSLVLTLPGMMLCIIGIPQVRFEEACMLLPWLLPGFVVGIIAWVQISRNPARLRGEGIARAGVVLCILTVAFLYTVAPILGMYRQSRGGHNNCLNNLKQIGTAINLYQTDWDDRFPLVSGPGREFERVLGMTWNYRTNSTGGERRWMQNVLSPYCKSKKIFMCPAVNVDSDTWTMGGKHPGVIHYWQNRHGGFTYDSEKSPDFHAKGNPQKLGVVSAPAGSSIKGMVFEDDPPTTYWFNAAVTDNSGKKQGTIVVSGQSTAVCDKSEDAPIVWDTPCGYTPPGSSEAYIPHEREVNFFFHETYMNVLYADGHAKSWLIPNLKANEWTKNHFGNTHGDEGWFPN